MEAVLFRLMFFSPLLLVSWTGCASRCSLSSVLTSSSQLYIDIYIISAKFYLNLFQQIWNRSTESRGEIFIAYVYRHCFSLILNAELTRFFI